MGLKDKLIITGFSLFALSGLSWMIGGERILCLSDPTQRIEESSFAEYSQDCTNPASKALAYFAYPSARLARYIHNSMVE